MKLEAPFRRDVPLGAALSVFAPHLRAQSFPVKPVRLVVPYSPGGGADATGSTPHELATFPHAEMTRRAEVVKVANIKIE